jgi:hypothetical protein
MKQKNKVEKVQAEIVKPERGMVKRADAGKAQAQEMTPEARVNVIRGHLDSMENVQTVFAAGAVTIGLELIALKAQTNKGEFEEIFKERIERPRFQMRTAQKYMQAADRVRTKLLKAGNETIATSWDVAPSAMTLQKRKSLTEALGELLTGKTLSDLLMGDRPVGGGGPGGKAPSSGAEAEMQATEQVYKALRLQITREIITRKAWKMLPEDELQALRQVLETAVKELPAKI